MRRGVGGVMLRSVVRRGGVGGKGRGQCVGCWVVGELGDPTYVHSGVST